jgi:hypothetical protein
VAPGPAELHSSYTADVVWAAGELLAGKGFLEKAIPGSKSSFPLLELLEPSKVRYRLMGGSYLLQHWHWHSGWHLSESLSLRVMMAVNARDWHGVGTEHWQSPHPDSSFCVMTTVMHWQYGRNRAELQASAVRAWPSLKWDFLSQSEYATVVFSASGNHHTSGSGDASFSACDTVASDHTDRYAMHHRDSTRNESEDAHVDPACPVPSASKRPKYV